MRARTFILATAAALAAGGAASQGAGAGTLPCAPPSKPVVSELTTTSASFSAAVNPNGRRSVGQFRIGRVLLYPVMLGNGSEAIRWRMSIASLKPGHRYTVVARSSGRGCRAHSSTTAFVTPKEGRGPRVAQAPAEPAAAAVEVTEPAPVEEEQWRW
jgi:hypothetical protein